MIRRWSILLLLGAVVLGGCATIPSGPSVMVLPAPGKPFEQFQADDGLCRQWAAEQIGVSPNAVAAHDTAIGAVAGTVIGAGLGAAIGAASGNPGAGAAIGAGAGLLGGTAVGANAGAASGWSAQRRYDAAYQQCMYAKGNQIPGVVRTPAQSPRRALPPPPPPPPPAGWTPPASPSSAGGPPPGPPAPAGVMPTPPPAGGAPPPPPPPPAQ